MFRIIFVFCSCFIYADSLLVLPLETRWFLYDRNYGDTYETHVPNGIYSDLKSIGKIGNIFQELVKESSDSNNVASRYYYLYDFTLVKSIQKASKIEIIFHGIDGVATIYFNEKEIGRASNTFVRYRFDIEYELLKFDEHNRIKINFESPIRTVSQLSTTYGSYISTYPRNERNEKNVHFLRRMQASFGIDWAPAVPSFGIWKPVQLVGYNENDLIIRDIMVTTTTDTISSTQPWKVEFVINCDIHPLLYHATTSTTDEDSRYIGDIKMFLGTEEDNIKFSKQIFLSKNEQQLNSINISISTYVPKEKVKLWWPNGYGSATRYYSEVTYSNANGEISKGILIGYRTIKLNQNRIELSASDAEHYFYFIVNDVPIFAKGANFLPVSIFLEKSSDEKKIDYLLQSAKDAHMNMIRVPASGIYQSDYFYEKCDKYGLLVWQDMMLDREMIPFEDEEYMKSLTEEIKQQYQRLQYHPSIAVWVASSEIQDTISQIMNDSKQEKWIKEYSTYLKIFVDIVKDDKSRPFLTSTPTNVYSNIENINFLSSQNRFSSGDVHLHYINDMWSVESTEIPPKFITKFGSWSLPSYEELLSQTEYNNEEDISSLETEFMKFRHRRDIRNAYTEITDSVTEHFGIPKNGHMNAFIYASQINQAWSMKVQTEFYRRCALYTSTQDTGKTMGALFWHLNDVWQMASASSIEYNGNWKVLHYYALKFFAPVGSSIELSKNSKKKTKIEVFLFSDLLEDIEINVKFEIFEWSKLKPIYENILRAITLKKSSLFHVEKIDFSKLLKSNCKKFIKKDCLLKLTIYKINKERNEESNNEQEELNTNYFLPETNLWKISTLSNPTVKAIVRQCDRYVTICKILVSTDSVALFVWLDMGEIAGYFSENGFIMTEKEKEILFYVKQETIVWELSRKINVKKVISKKYLRENFSPLNPFWHILYS